MASRVDRLWGGRTVRAAFCVAQVMLIALLVATGVVYGLVYIARGLDDVSYHIPVAVRVARYLNPYFVDTPVDSEWFPTGGETFAAVFVYLTGSIYSTNLSGALCLAGLCTLTYFAAGLWTKELDARASAVLCVASVPVLLGQCLAFYVDIHFALLVCGALWLQAAALIRGRSGYLWASVALAVASASIKQSGLYAAGIVVPVSLICLFLLPPPRRPTWMVAVLVAAAVLFSSGFYVRNWWLRGNPLFPFELPAWSHPLLALSPAAYEGPERAERIVLLQRRTAVPHPWWPASWGKLRLKPDMTDDAFGAAGALALLGCAVSLVFARRLDQARRRAWLVVLAQTAVIAALVPLRGGVPRYVAFAPAVAAMSPAVLAAADGGARLVGQLLGVGILLNAAVFAGTNLLIDTREWTSLHQAVPLLHPYRPNGARALAYAQGGHLRIGYTSGFANMIGLLYDPGLTNELVPLHYRDYTLHHGREFGSPEEFIAHVRALDLDYIQIFDLRYPGAELLQQHFADKVHVWRR